ncbi:MAG: DUF2835 domain-containing protein [Oceanospirillaceae bacterium]|nr:DUF2835 domain-containing protein [Oceanospirillaceae bacterium]
MNRIIIDIRISNEEYLKQYQQSNCMVNTVSRDGRSIMFPANILKPFLLHSGISGSFCIVFDSAGKFQSISRY